METALAMSAETDMQDSAPAASAGFASVPTKPAPIPAGSGHASARLTSASTKDESTPPTPATVPAKDPAWKETLREKVHRSKEKIRAMREKDAGGPAAKKMRLSGAAAGFRGAGRGSPGGGKRKKLCERSDGEPSLKRTAKDNATIKGPGRGSGSRSSSPASERRVEDSSAQQRKDDSRRGRQRGGRPSSPAPPPQSAPDRTPRAAPERSLLVDDHGRKVSRAGVTVDTPLNDLLDSMLLAGGSTATAAGKGKGRSYANSGKVATV